jgi:hypothetical protein
MPSGKLLTARAEPAPGVIGHAPTVGPGDLPVGVAA